MYVYMLVNHINIVSRLYLNIIDWNCCKVIQDLYDLDFVKDHLKGNQK